MIFWCQISYTDGLRYQSRRCIALPVLVKFTYPVKSSLVLADHWPVSVGDIKLEWSVEEGRVTAISGTVPVTERDQLPTVQPSATPGVKLHIDFGRSSREGDVEEAIRTIWGLLSLFAGVEVVVDSVKPEWIPENDNDRERLNIYSFSRGVQKADLLEPRRLSYDLVVRAMASAKAAAHYEIPLGFLRRGTRAIYNGQYIEAYYNLFFFLETLFAPGYSDPKRVKERLWAAKVVKDAVAQSRAPFSNESRLNASKRDKLLGMTDEQLLYHLVDLRGNLHHHALGRPGIWHPDKADRFHEEAILLQQIVHSIAMADAMAVLFAPEQGEVILRSARDAGAITIVRVEASGLINGVKQQLKPISICVPSRRIDREVLDAVHRRFREQFRGGPKNVQVLEYKLMSEDASRVYAVWHRAGSEEPTHQPS